MNKIVLFFENLNLREKILAFVCFSFLGIFLAFNLHENFIKYFFTQSINDINLANLNNKNTNLKQKIKNITKQIDEKNDYLNKTQNIEFIQNCEQFIKDIFKNQKYTFSKIKNAININFKANFANTLCIINNLENTNKSIFINDICIQNTNSNLLNTNIKLNCIQKDENE